MNKDFYNSEDFLNKEYKTLFSNLWIFCCPHSFLKNNHDFIIIPFAGREVIIQNFNGEILAYDNICPHRFKRLIFEKHGNKVPTCSYHGWTISKSQKIKDKNSLLVGIPFNYEAHNLDFTKIEITQYKISIFSGLIFIADKDVNHCIEEQMPSEVIEKLSLVMKAIDSDILISNLERKFNWKLILENLRDPLHPIFVHSKTLTNYVDIGIENLPNRSIEDIDHSDMKLLEISRINTHYHEHKLKGIDEDHIYNSIKRCLDYEAYMNWLIFPNTHICSSNTGRTILIESYLPIRHNKTLVNLFIFSSKKEKKIEKGFLQDIYKHSYTVLDEDFRIVEKVQESFDEEFYYPDMNIGKSDWHLSCFIDAVENITKLK